MSVWDAIFGVVGGPAAPFIDKSDATRGALIGTIGGLGGTAIEAGAGDTKGAQTGLVTDEVLGSIAATAGTLGAAAPAGAATVGATTAADASAEAAPAVVAPAVETAAEGATSAIPAAGSATVAVPLEAGTGAAAGLATPTASTIAGTAAPTENAVAAAADPTAKIASSNILKAGTKAVKAAGTAFDDYNKINNAFQQKQNQGQEPTSQQPYSQPQLQAPLSPSIAGIATDPFETDSFNAIFGKNQDPMQKKTLDNMVNPTISFPTKPIPEAIQTPPPARTAQDFYNQINGLTKANPSLTE